MDPRGWFTIAALISVLTSGCASSGTMSQQQALAQIGTTENKQSLNRQIANLGAQAAVKGPQDYQLGSEDLLDIGVYGQEDMHRLVRVNGNGEIAMPLLGPLNVIGCDETV